MAKVENKKTDFWVKYTNLFVFVFIAAILIYWVATNVGFAVTPNDGLLISMPVVTKTKKTVAPAVQTPAKTAVPVKK